MADNVNAVRDSTGQYRFNPEALPVAFTYTGPGGALDTITVGPDYLGNLYRQTLSYTNGNLSGVSAWVMQ